MKSSIPIVIAFLAGAALGSFLIPSENGALSKAATYTLYLLIFCVGVGVGSKPEVASALRKMHFRILLVPFAVVFGTLIGAAAASLALRGLPLSRVLAIGAGFGYYSLSSVIIAREAGDVLGATALVSNLLREVATLLLAPFLARRFGRLAPVASGGATAMDTTLPVIARVSGEECALIAVFSGVVLTILVPILVPLFLRLR